MRRAGLIVLGLLFLSMGYVFAQRRGAPRCEVPLAWGDAVGVTAFTPTIHSRKPVRSTTELVVMFEAADGTVRLVRARGCRALAVIARN